MYKIPQTRVAATTAPTLIPATAGVEIPFAIVLDGAFVRAVGTIVVELVSIDLFVGVPMVLFVEVLVLVVPLFTEVVVAAEYDKLGPIVICESIGSNVWQDYLERVDYSQNQTVEQ